MVKIVNEELLTINQVITGMPHKHFTLEQRNALAALLKAEIKKKDIAKQFGKDMIYKYTYEKRKDLVRYLHCQKGKYGRRYGTRIREKQREALK